MHSWELKRMPAEKLSGFLDDRLASLLNQAYNSTSMKEESWKPCWFNTTTNLHSNSGHQTSLTFLNP
jgi:hypothetical protein